MSRKEVLRRANIKKIVSYLKKAFILVLTSPFLHWIKKSSKQPLSPFIACIFLQYNQYSTKWISMLLNAYILKMYSSLIEFKLIQFNSKVLVLVGFIHCDLKLGNFYIDYNIFTRHNQFAKPTGWLTILMFL